MEESTVGTLKHHQGSDETPVDTPARSPTVQGGIGFNNLGRMTTVVARYNATGVISMFAGVTGARVGGLWS